MMKDLIDPPRAHGQPLFRGVLKGTPADFRVEENLGIEASGEGEHLLLQIEKTAMNTDEVISLLQEWYSVGSADVGFCGMKDRHSISSQWVSLRTPLDASVFEQAAQQFSDAQGDAQEDAEGDARPDTQVTEDSRKKSLCLLASSRHGRKLRRGAHSKNTFAITLRDVVPNADDSASVAGALQERIEAIMQQGFPNFIGAQRFGRGGQNVQRAQQWFGNSRKRISRQQRSLYLSTGRSALFNLVCAARVLDGSWNQLRVGEPAVLDGSHSFFVAKPDSEESRASEQRLDSFDIHPSAPWWGRGRSPATDDCADFENELLKPYQTMCAALEKAGLSMERRALRARAQDFSHRWLDEQTLELRFSLSPGLYATTLLREFCTAQEPQR